MKIVRSVSASFFPLLDVKPVLGRTFTESEDLLGGAPVALISENLWKRKFASSLDVVGKSIDLNDTMYTIVGIIPASFHYHNVNFHDDKDVYVPIGQWSDPVRSKNSTRLLPGTGPRRTLLGANRERYAKGCMSIMRKVTEATSEDDHDGLMALCFGAAYAARW